MRIARSAAPSRAAAGAPSSSACDPFGCTRNTLPWTPGGRPSAFAIRSRPPPSTSTHCVVASMACRSTVEWRRRRERPVRDRPQVEQHGTGAREEALRHVVAPASAHACRGSRRSPASAAPGYARARRPAADRDPPSVAPGRASRTSAPAWAARRPSTSPSKRTKTIRSNCSRPRSRAATNGSSRATVVELPDDVVPPEQAAERSIERRQRPSTRCSDPVTRIATAIRSRLANRLRSTPGSAPSTACRTSVEAPTAIVAIGTSALRLEQAGARRCAAGARRRRADDRAPRGALAAQQVDDGAIGGRAARCARRGRSRPSAGRRTPRRRGTRRRGRRRRRRARECSSVTSPLSTIASTSCSTPSIRSRVSIASATSGRSVETSGKRSA